MFQPWGLAKRYTRSLYRYYIEWNIYRLLGLRALPSRANYSIAAIGNSRRVMCDEWLFLDQLKSGDQPKAVKTLLDDRRFRHLCHWGIAGNKPFLHQDIVEICAAGLEMLPRLKTLTISTDAYHTEHLKMLIPQINALCKAKGVRLHLLLFLDDLGEVHNRASGASGTFAQAWRTIQWVRDETDVELAIGSVLSSNNIQEAFKIWHFCTRENIAINFWLAIKRWDNQSLWEAISLDQADRYTLIELLENIAHHWATPLERRLFYQSIRESLTKDIPQDVECRFKEEGICLSRQGLHHRWFVDSNNLRDPQNASVKKQVSSSEPEELSREMLRVGSMDCAYHYITLVPIRKIIAYAWQRSKIPQIYQLAIGIVACTKEQLFSSSSR